MNVQTIQKEVQKQKTHHNYVEKDRFFWQTRNNYIKKIETKLLEPLADIMKETKSERILETGCGEGANIYNIAEYMQKIGIKGIKLTGIDYSQEKILFAQRNNPSSTFQRMDATKLDYADGSFDIIFARDILHHIPEKNKLVCELLRVAKKGLY